MDINILLAILAFGTLFAVTVFALVSKSKVDKRRNGDVSVPKSTLARDKVSDGKPADV